MNNYDLLWKNIDIIQEEKADSYKNERIEVPKKPAVNIAINSENNEDIGQFELQKSMPLEVQTISQKIQSNSVVAGTVRQFEHKNQIVINLKIFLSHLRTHLKKGLLIQLRLKLWPLERFS